jgi:hypothetical protein
MTNDEEGCNLLCLMGKGEKVESKPKTKPSSLPSDESDIDASDDSSDDKMDKKSKNFIAKLMEELEKTQAILVK